MLFSTRVSLLYKNSLNEWLFVNKPQINRKLDLGKKIKPLKALINKDFSTILFGAEGETRQGVALSLLRKI